MLKIPPNARNLREWPNSTTWFDEDGILYSLSKKGPAPSMEETRKTMEEFQRQIGDTKICMLIDVTNTAPSTKERREYAATELPKIVKAVAMVSDSPLGTMLANLFFTVKTLPYPTKMFRSEEEAREWLKNYL